MSVMTTESDDNTSGFYKLVKDALSDSRKGIPNVKDILEEISLVAGNRGFNDEEFSLLLKFVSKGSISVTNKIKLLRYLVPCSGVPPEALERFMVWFISNYKSKLKTNQTVSILQWIIGLLDNDLADPKIIDIFYYDFLHMVQRYNELVKYACKLLCKLTTPEDVTLSSVRVVSQKYKTCADSDAKFLLALLNVFKGYKPHLIKKGSPDITVKQMKVSEAFKRIPQNMDFFMKLGKRRCTYLEKPIPGSVQALPVSVHNIVVSRSNNSQHKISSLVPFPTFDGKGSENLTTYPASIVETYQRLWSVPIPDDILSLLRDDVGLFLLMYRGEDVQSRFSQSLLHTLQRVFIYQDQPASEEDKDFLLSRIYELQMFLHQGLPCVSFLLSGYLLNWDGLDHRFGILSLIEWVTFDSFEDLSKDILRPLYYLFVSCDTTMKKQILQTCIKLISHIFVADIYRNTKGLPHPFLKRAPKWIEEPIPMLQSLVEFVEGLIKVGTCLHPGNTPILKQAIDFYEKMNRFETMCDLPMWTVISQDIFCHIVFSMAPVLINKLCKLLLTYHAEFLPRLLLQQRDFYDKCTSKIDLVTKFSKELINLLWKGQAMSKREDGIVLKSISDETLESAVAQFYNPSLYDTAFDVANNLSFMPYYLLEKQKNGPNFLNKKEDYLAVLGYHLEHVAEFIKYFSRVFQEQSDLVTQFEEDI